MSSEHYSVDEVIYELRAENQRLREDWKLAKSESAATMIENQRLREAASELERACVLMGDRGVEVSAVRMREALAGDAE
jgi:hypothetical protein